MLICALLAVTSVCNAQLLEIPTFVEFFLKTPELRHATVAIELKDLTTDSVLFQMDEQRSVQPASLLKLLTTAAALRKLGGDALVLDTLQCVDSAAVPIPELVGYNGDWLIEDVASTYVEPLTLLPDVGLTLREFVKKTNEESLNSNAEMLAYWLGQTNRIGDGIDSIATYWKNQGLDTEALTMYDGCGLAPADRVTAHMMVQLLQEMQFDVDFRNSLPVSGETGTLKLFLKKTRLEGKAQLKTGTTKSVCAYAGYVKGSDEHDYAIALIVNNHKSQLASLRKNIEKMLLFLIP